MRHLTYLAVLAGCLAGALWLEPALRVRVLRQWRRLLLTVVPIVLVFGGWDVAAIAARHWSYDPAQTTGIRLPGRLPLEELLFFLVVPVCSVLGYEAVRLTRERQRQRRERQRRERQQPERERRGEPAGRRSDRVAR